MSNPKGYVTVVGAVYHQLLSDQPSGVPVSFRIPVTTEDQPFDRRLTIDETPKTLAQLGCWIADASQIVVANEAGVRATLNPEPGRYDNCIVEVGVAIVRPGMDCRFEPMDMNTLTLRSRSGKIAIRIIVYPR